MDTTRYPNHNCFARSSVVFVAVLAAIAIGPVPAAARVSMSHVAPGGGVDLILLSGVRHQGIVLRKRRKRIEFETRSSRYTVAKRQIAAIRMPGEREADYLLRAAEVFRTNGHPSMAIKYLSDAYHAGAPRAVVDLYTAECFIAKRKYRAALGTNLKAQRGADSAMADVVLEQHARILTALDRRRASRAVAARSSASPASGDRAPLRPEVTVKADGSYGQKELSPGEPVEQPVEQSLASSPAKETDLQSRVELGCRWRVIDGRRLRLSAGPLAGVNLPFDEPYGDRYSGGVDIRLTTTGASRRSQELTLRIERSVRNGLAASNSARLEWTGIRSGKAGGAWVLSLGATRRISDDWQSDDFLGYLSAIRSRPLPATPLITLRLSALGLYLSSPQADPRLQTRRIGATGIAEGDSILIDNGDSITIDESARYYGRDGQPLELVDLFDSDTLASAAAPTKEQRVGARATFNQVWGVLTLGAELRASSWLSFDLKAGPSIRYYPLPYRWDNWEGNTLFTSDGSVLVLADSVSGEDFMVQYVSDPHDSSAWAYRLVGLHTTEKVRVDYRFDMRAGLRFRFGPVGSLLAYTKLRVNRSTLGPDSPFDTDYWEIVPGITWRTRL